MFRSLLLTLCALSTGLHAQLVTPAAAATVAAAAVPAVSLNNTALIVTVAGTQALTPGETAILRSAMTDVSASTPDLATAQATLTLLSAGIAAAHGAAAGAPWSITADFSLQVTLVPPAPPPPVTPTWSAIANEGQTVKLAAGTQVRFGAKAGTRFGADQSGAPSAADEWSATITIAKDETIVVNAGTLGIADPIAGYVKELDVLAGTGSATLVP